MAAVSGSTSAALPILRARSAYARIRAKKRGLTRVRTSSSWVSNSAPIDAPSSTIAVARAMNGSSAGIAIARARASAARASSGLSIVPCGEAARRSRTSASRRAARSPFPTKTDGSAGLELFAGAPHAATNAITHARCITRAGYWNRPPHRTCDRRAGSGSPTLARLPEVEGAADAEAREVRRELRAVVEVGVDGGS
jgi:hypothetical protein